MKRREFLTAALGLALGGALSGRAVASVEKPFYVVKLISFSCNFCRESELGDALMLKEIAQRGGELVTAPLDLSTPPLFLRESVFYASRAFGSEYALAVRDSLYRATQDRGLTFSTLKEVLTWLETDIPSRFSSEQLSRLMVLAEKQDVKNAIGRAVNLAVASGTDYLPAYLLLHQGQVVGLYDRESFPQSGILRAKLLEHIRTLPAGAAPNTR